MNELITEELKRIHLLFGYDTRKTLTENVLSETNFGAVNDIHTVLGKIGHDLNSMKSRLGITMAAHEITGLLAQDAKSFEKTLLDAMETDIKMGHPPGTLGPAATDVSKVEVLRGLAANPAKTFDEVVADVKLANQKRAGKFGAGQGTGHGNTGGGQGNTGGGKGNTGGGKGKGGGGKGKGGGRKTKKQPTPKDVGIIKKMGKWIKENPWKSLLTLGLTGAGLYYLLKKNTTIAQCLLDNLSEEEIAGLNGSTTGEVTRAAVGNRFADINGGLVFGMDNGKVKTGNGKYEGTYTCEGDAIKIKIGGQEFTLGGGGGTKPTGGGGEVLPPTPSSYHSCPDTFPIEMYCKNSTVRKVQNCLTIRADGAFGPQTQKALEGKGLPGDKITQDTVNKVCGGGGSTTTTTTTPNTSKPPGSDTDAD